MKLNKVRDTNFGRGFRNDLNSDLDEIERSHYSQLDEIESIRNQVDNVAVESGGDSNAEVVQARTDEVGTVHQSLDARLRQMKTGVEEELFEAQQGQVTFILKYEYMRGHNHASVFLNGRKATRGVDYSESSKDSITFSSSLNKGELVLIRYYRPPVPISDDFQGSVDQLQDEFTRTREDIYGNVFASLNARLERLDLQRYWVNVREFGADPTGKKDSTQAVRAAIEYLLKNISQAGGGIKFPNGIFKISGKIDVPWGISIIGSEDTNIQVFHEDTPCFLLKGRHYVDKLKFYYPNQDMSGNNIIRYKAAIATDDGANYISITNINLGNSFVGIDCDAGVIRLHISNITGFPIERGIVINNSLDVASISDVHFNPNEFGVPSTKLKNYIWHNGIAIVAGRLDWATFDRCFAYGYSQLFQITSGSRMGGSANNIRITNWGSDACRQFFTINHHDGGIVFENGIGASFYPYDGSYDAATAAIDIQGPTDITVGWGGKYVKFLSNRFYRAEQHLLWSKSPIKFMLNEVSGYASSAVATAVIDAIHLTDQCDESIIVGNSFDGKNRAINRCIALINGNGHKLMGNIYNGTKQAVYVHDKAQNVITDDREALRSFSNEGTAPPTSGYWKQGNMVWNSNPQKGQPLGWVCLSPGSPGVWHHFGVIQ